MNGSSIKFELRARLYLGNSLPTAFPCANSIPICQFHGSLGQTAYPRLAVPQFLARNCRHSVNLDGVDKSIVNFAADIGDRSLSTM